MKNNTVYIQKTGVIALDGTEAGFDCSCAAISVSEVAKILGCARSSVYKAIIEGRFPALKIGSTIRIPRLALDRMLETGDMNPQVTEMRVYVDETGAQRVAEIVVKKLLCLEQQRLADQLRTINGDVKK